MMSQQFHFVYAIIEKVSILSLSLTLFFSYS
jgi:hypothetical protein